MIYCDYKIFNHAHHAFNNTYNIVVMGRASAGGAAHSDAWQSEPSSGSTAACAPGPLQPPVEAKMVEDGFRWTFEEGRTTRRCQ